MFKKVKYFSQNKQNTRKNSIYKCMRQMHKNLLQYFINNILSVLQISTGQMAINISNQNKKQYGSSCSDIGPCILQTFGKIVFQSTSSRATACYANYVRLWMQIFFWGKLVKWKKSKQNSATCAHLVYNKTLTANSWLHAHYLQSQSLTNSSDGGVDG